MCPAPTPTPPWQTWRNWDLSRMTMHELYTQFGLDVQTIDFVGHAIALHQNDAYMMQARDAEGQPHRGTGTGSRACGWRCRLPAAAADQRRGR